MNQSEELEQAIKAQVEIRITKAALGIYKGVLSDGTYYEAQLHRFSVDTHDMDLGVIFYQP